MINYGETSNAPGMASAGLTSATGPSTLAAKDAAANILTKAKKPEDDSDE